jgi:hypothetical protein
MFSFSGIALSPYHYTLYSPLPTNKSQRRLRLFKKSRYEMVSGMQTSTTGGNGRNSSVSEAGPHAKPKPKTLVFVRKWG